MHNAQTQQQFIALRAQGRSYTSIAAELKVSQRSLIDWSRKFQFEIQNQRAIELEALQQQFLASREDRVRALGGRLRQVEELIGARDLSQLSTPRLFSLAESLRRQILRATGEVRFSSPVSEIPEPEYHEQAHDWNG